MIKKIRTVIRMYKSFKDDRTVGDVPVLKMTLFSSSEGYSAFRDQALKQKDLNFESISMDNLKRLPEGTLGNSWYRFMEKNRLRPFNFSSEISGIYESYPVTIRYVRLHDLFHTILGFDASISGEMGVYRFVGEQHYTRSLDFAAFTARVLGWLLFWKRKAITRAVLRGKKLSEGAEILVIQPLETWLHRPLNEIREELLPEGSFKQH